MRKLVLALGIMLATAAPAAAQVCGDANDSNTVTITDGVQALRSAAGLSSSCQDGCDVDGSGAITVSDGVNILRKAAGLPINESCDFTGEEANGVVNPSLSVFDGMTKVPGFIQQGALAAGTQCENDGSIDSNTSGSSSVVSFGDCQIGDVIFDGTISRAVFGAGVVLGFDGFKITPIATGESFTFNGSLSVNSEQANRRLGGTLSVTSSEHGSFTILFQRILLAGDGSVIQGQLIFDLTKATGLKIATIEITFNDGDEFPVTVRLRNEQVKQFILDRDTGLLVPAV